MGEFVVGKDYPAVVKKVLEYGIFVEIKAGLSALCHQSELGYNPRKINPKTFAKINDTIMVRICEIDTVKRRISVSHRLTQENPWEKLKKEYNLDFALTPDINYSILPKPHYIVNDVVIFNEKMGYQKEFSQIKKLKIFINQNNFFKMNNVIKKVEIKNANFFIENSDFKFINNFLDNGFSKKTIKILKSKIFDNLEPALENIDYIIATSARFRNKNIKHIQLEDLKKIDFNKKIAFLFG